MEKTIEQRRLELLDETVQHFSNNPRARLGELAVCRYSHRINGGCAIGRKISAELAEILDAKPANDMMSIFHLLPVELIQLGLDFLTQLQNLHDRNQYWGIGGLNRYGTYIYEKIKGILYTKSRDMNKTHEQMKQEFDKRMKNHNRPFYVIVSIFVSVFIIVLWASGKLKENHKQDHNIGSRIVLANDTLMVLSFDIYHQDYVLSNGIHVDEKIIEQNTVK